MAGASRDRAVRRLARAVAAHGRDRDALVRAGRAAMGPTPAVRRARAAVLAAISAAERRRRAAVRRGDREAAARALGERQALRHRLAALDARWKGDRSAPDQPGRPATGIRSNITTKGGEAHDGLVSHVARDIRAEAAAAGAPLPLAVLREGEEQAMATADSRARARARARDEEAKVETVAVLAELCERHDPWELRTVADLRRMAAALLALAERLEVADRRENDAHRYALRLVRDRWPTDDPGPVRGTRIAETEEEPEGTGKDRTTPRGGTP